MVQETLLSLTAWIKKGGHEVPAEWLQAPAPSDEVEHRDHLLRVAHHILKRRVADAFREHVRKWANDVLDPTRPPPALATAPDVAGTADARTKLAIVAGYLSRTDYSDRELLLKAAGLAGEPGQEPLTATERKRVERLRRKISEQLGATLGYTHSD